MASSRYNRIVLKVSGECFGSETSINLLIRQLKEIQSLALDTAIVVGGGNVLRGRDAGSMNIDRVRADQIGMLSTVISGILLDHGLEQAGLPACHLSALNITGLVEPYTLSTALTILAQKRILILSGGIGNPFFSTDTAAAVRASELKAHALLKGTKVDGVYTADPETDPTARRYTEITYEEAIEKNLAVMDATAFSLCRQERIPIIVFNILKQGSLKKVTIGETIGTVIC